MSLKAKIKRTKFYRKFSYDNFTRKKAIIFIAIFCLLAGMTTGLAYMQEQLQIRGSINIAHQSNEILITNITMSNSSNASINFTPSFTDTTATISSIISTLDGTITYNIVIRNNTDSVKTLYRINEEANNNPNIEYHISGININDIINPEEEKNISITFNYDPEITDIPENTTIGVVIKFDFEPEIIIKNYITDGIMLNLRALDEDTDNQWINAVSSTNPYHDYYAVLENTTHNTTYKYVEFNGNNSKATLSSPNGNNLPIIPETGDFTAEIYFTTPINFNTNIDMALISQVNKTNYDGGRFKLNLKYENSTYNLTTFVNYSTSTTSGANSHTYNFSTDALTLTKYHMQLVRNGTNLLLYLNGNLIATETMDPNYIISQGPFNIGFFNNKSNQYFKGHIYAVRIYNRGLSLSELQNNIDVDNVNYSINTEANTILAAALNNLTTSGEGLREIEINEYRFKGINVPNYVAFNGEEDIWRIIAFNPDNTMKLINVSQLKREFNIPFDSGKRESSSYCTMAASIAEYDANGNALYNGCNAWSIRENVLEDSTIKIFLNTTYYNSLSENMRSKILTHDFYSGLMGRGITTQAALTQARSSVWNGNIGLLTMDDVLYSSENLLTNIGTSQVTLNSWIIKLIPSNIGAWTMTGASFNTFDVWMIQDGATFGSKRASRYAQPTINPLKIFYAMPTIYVSSSVRVSGSGTSIDPYLID